MAEQPDWVFLENLGDASPLEYGGQFVYEDRTGVYAPEMEVVEVDDDGRVTIYRFILDRCTFVDGVLSDNKFHPDYPVWFCKSLPSLSAYCGIPVSEMVAAFCSDNILERARAYCDVGSYWGFDELDQYPLRMDPIEAQNRYLQKNGERYRIITVDPDEDYGPEHSAIQDGKPLPGL